MSQTSFEKNPSSPHHILIVGGGAGGLELAVRLGKKLGKKKQAQITLVDAARTHIWKPLLHQVAAGTLDSRSDELEYLAVAQSNHFTFRLGRMDGINRQTKEIYLASTYDEEGNELLPRQAISYTTLILAVGSQTNDFGTPGAKEHTIMLDSPPAAERFHQKLINSCLRAQAQGNQPDGSRFIVTIIGGGATGVELAAELHTTTKLLSHYGLDHFDPEKDLKIVIVDAAPRLLQMLPERLSAAVTHELREIDIDIHTHERVTHVTHEGVYMASGTFIRSNIVVWAAGIKAPDFLKTLDGLETNRNNQLLVHRTLQTIGDPAIFALGDCAACPDKNDSFVPPRAQSAHQQASLLASSLSGWIQHGRPLSEFLYKDFGSLVSLGKYSTVGSLMGAITRGSVFIEGKIAQWMYWSLHKQHQIVVNGVFHTLLSTLAETINRARNPRIKLH